MEERLAEPARTAAPPPTKDDGPPPGGPGKPQTPETPPPGEPGKPGARASGPSPDEPAIWSRNFRYYFTARSAGLLSWAMLPVAVAAGLLSGGYGLDTAGYSMAFLVAPFAGLVLFGGCSPTGSPPAG